MSADMRCCRVRHGPDSARLERCLNRPYGPEKEREREGYGFGDAPLRALQSHQAQGCYPRDLLEP